MQVSIANELKKHCDGVHAMQACVNALFYGCFWFCWFLKLVQWNVWIKMHIFY